MTPMMKHSLMSVSDETKMLGIITHKVHRQQRERRERSSSAVGEWFEKEPFSSIQGGVGVVRDTYEIQPCTKVLYWPQHRFYINRIHWNRIMHTEK